jgi:RNA polymerase sigma-70 factor (family 1)
MSRSEIADRLRLTTASAAPDSDEQLLDRIGAGDAEAFGTLLRERWRALVLYCARVLDASDVAEDIAQEAFIRLWENRSRWKRRSSARALLYTIARNLALNERKASSARARRAAQWIVLSARAPATDQRAEAGEFRLALQRAIDELPARKREVVMLSRFDGLSRSEIASVTGLSEQTVANYLTAALTSLRTSLGSFLGDP